MGNRVLLQTGVQQKTIYIETGPSFCVWISALRNSKTGSKDTENVTGPSLQESKI